MGRKLIAAAAVVPADIERYGSLTAFVHMAGYTLERAFADFKYLLAEERWRGLGHDFADGVAFLDSIRFDNFRMLAEQRKDIARQIKQLVPGASNRAIAKSLGVDHQTVNNDLGETSPGRGIKPNQINDGRAAVGEASPAAAAALSGAAAARAVERAEGAAERKERKAAAKLAVPGEAAFSDAGPFATLVVDPPWDVEKIDRAVRPNQAAFDYPTMSVDALLEFWIKDLRPRLADDVHAFLWTTQKWLPEALRLLSLVDFKYVLTMVWHKPGGFQPVGLPQYNCEFVIYARRGLPVFVDTKEFNCCFTGERREHSRKPDAFYDLVRRVTAPARVDVFSREPRAGFAQYGNEPGRFAA